MNPSDNSIIIFCKTLLIGGAEKQALILSKLMKGRNINTTLVNWCGHKIDAAYLNFIKDNSIKYVGLEGNPIKKCIHLFRIIDHENISIILSYLTLANFIAGIFKLFHPELITIGGIRTEKLPLYKFIFEKFVHNHLNDATVFNNYSAREKFENKGFDARRIYVIHNVINVLPRKGNKKSRDGVTIVSVSRFVKSKDFPTALYVFKKLTEEDRNKKLRYCIVGYGPVEPEIRSMVNRLNLNNEVEILINPPDIPEILRSCDIYLSTSLYEGLSNSIMEAMAAGLPVVATDVGDNRYLVKDSYNGFIVPCRDINSIVDKLESLIYNEELRNELGNNGFDKIASEFSENMLIDNYFRLFSKIPQYGKY